MKFNFVTTWTNEQRMAQQSSTTYNDATIIYSMASETYDGKALPVWTNETRNT